MSEPADLQIRLAEPEERGALEALQWRASLALGEYNEQLKAHPGVISVPEEQIELGEVFVAELDGDIAGFVVILISETQAELDGLFVEPRLWRQGIGSKLVDFATHGARKRGLTLIVVANPSARKFYEKCGFAFESEAETQFGPALAMSR